MSDRIGFIGLGIMGRGMFQNLLKGGSDLTVWNRTSSRMDELVAAGAKPAQSPADLAARCDVVISCVSDTPDVREVMLAMQALWSQEVASFAGEFVRFEPSWQWPKPVQQPRPPVLIGAAPGPTLYAHVAEFGDGWIPFGGAGIKKALPELRRALETQGRDPQTLEVVPMGVFPDAAKLAYYREQGVEVLPEELVEGIEGESGRLTVRTRSGRTLGADAVVAGLGIVPETSLAEAAGLPVDDGVLVDSLGRVEGYEDVFAAGDVARFPVPALGGSRRVEHEDHANTHGRVVGANMTGAGHPYDHLPFFYSDLFDLGYEAVGDVDSRLAKVEEWAEPNRKGVVGYVDAEGRGRGFLLWDVWGKVDAARELIRGGARLDAAALRSLLD